MSKNWTQLWLKYDSKTSNGNEIFFSNISVEGFEENSRVIKNAIIELKAGAKGMLGVEAKVSDSTKGLLIKKVSVSEVGAEGYHIKEQDGVLSMVLLMYLELLPVKNPLAESTSALSLTIL